MLKTLRPLAAGFTAVFVIAALASCCHHHRDKGCRDCSGPADVAVMGFDDGDVAAAADLTTVRQPFEESGSTALRILIGHIGGSALRSTTTLEVQLVARSTT